VYVKEALGVQYATPAVVDVLVNVGEVPLVTAIPPEVYPVPLTSLVLVNWVVEALIVAEAKYNAALNELPVLVVKF